MLACQRDLFSLPEDVHYLNCATLGPMSKRSEKAGIESLRIGRNPMLRSRNLFFDPVQKSKEQFAQLINSKSDSIAIIPSVSYGIATVCKNIQIQSGDEVIVLEDQFPSNFFIWRKKCQAVGAELVIIHDPKSDNKSTDWTSEIIAQINPKTKVVTMCHVHWMDGTYFDLERISEACKKHGTYLIIDGTQSVGALPFDVQKIKPDALIVASYKWLLSSYGLGFAYFSDRLLNGEPLEENWINKERSHEFENLTAYIEAYQPGAARYSMGEKSNFISMAITNEALDLLNEIGSSNIQAYAQFITEKPWQELAAAGIKIDPSKHSYHITGLRFDDRWDLKGIQERLQSRNVVTSQRGSALRISVNMYNKPDDIDALVDCILNR